MDQVSVAFKNFNRSEKGKHFINQKQSAFEQSYFLWKVKKKLFRVIYWTLAESPLHTPWLFRCKLNAHVRGTKHRSTAHQWSSRRTFTQI